MCIDTLIQQLCCTHRLDQAQWAALLRGAGAQEAEHLAQAAQAEAVARFGKKIYVRGLIEFTNYCRNDCYYCGIRRSNKNVSRYRLTKEEILNRIKEGGVVGMGGAGFPTRVKLSPKEPDKIDYIIDYKLKIIILCNYICLTHLKLRQIKNIIYNTEQCLSRIFYVRSIL